MNRNQISKLFDLNENIVLGGVWVRLEAEWREYATHLKNIAKQQPPTPICQTKFNRFKTK